MVLYWSIVDHLASGDRWPVVRFAGLCRAGVTYTTSRLLLSMDITVGESQSWLADWLDFICLPDCRRGGSRLCCGRDSPAQPLQIYRNSPKCVAGYGNSDRRSDGAHRFFHLLVNPY